MAFLRHKPSRRNRDIGEQLFISEETVKVDIRTGSKRMARL